METSVKVLAIETSCDETAVAIIEGSGAFPHVHLKTKAELVLSQAAKHAEYGGVFPSLAKREHAQAIVPLLEEALKKAGLLRETTRDLSAHREALETLFSHEAGLADRIEIFLSRIEVPEIDAIAVTAGPGLAPALWVGINAAKALGIVWNLPIMPINHMEGHFVAPLVEHGVEKTELPVLGLLISGGHTEFAHMEAWHSFSILGRTVDDAVGEAFDKVARLLGLPYPGGPAISNLAEDARQRGLVSPFTLPRPMATSGDLRFSFSGLKTAVLYTLRDIETITDETRQMIALEFENAAADVLVQKTRAALNQTGAQTFLIGGGVAANAHIRRELTKLIETEFPDIALLLPHPSITGDNAVMIGQVATLRLLSGDMPKGGDIRADGNLSL